MRTHLPKQTLTDAMEDLLLPTPIVSTMRSRDELYMADNEFLTPQMTEEDVQKIASYNSHYTAIEFDESLNNLWTDLMNMSGQ